MASDRKGAVDQRKVINPRQIVAGALIVLAVVFIAENRLAVQIRLIVPVATLPLWLTLAGIFVLGGATGWLLARRRASKKS